MSDIICTNCGGTTTAGCWLCNPDVYAPTLSPYTDPTDWKKEAARLREEAWSWMQVAQERLSRAEAAEAKLAKVLEGMEEIARSGDIEGFGEFIRGQASGWNQCRAQVQAILKEARS